MQGALLALHPSLASRCRTLARLSPQIFHLQTIIMIYIVTAWKKALHMPWVVVSFVHPRRRRQRSPAAGSRALTLAQQRQLFDGNALQQRHSCSLYR
jgi:hypothetical protein